MLDSHFRSIIVFAERFLRRFEVQALPRCSIGEELEHLEIHIGVIGDVALSRHFAADVGLVLAVLVSSK